MHSSQVDYYINLINELPKFTSKHSVEESKAFLRCLGSPEEGMRILHVAGTNGKGSVCAYMESILMHGGYKTGCFVSPHLTNIRERIRIMGMPCSDEDFVSACQEVCRVSEQSFYPTFFEFLFFAAILIFKKRQVDIVILETGMGGRLDATNLPENKELAVIASIGMDHTEHLGDTLEKIAEEKAGIIRAGVPIVYWDSDKTEDAELYKGLRRIHSIADSLGAEEHRLSQTLITKVVQGKGGIDFCLACKYDNNVCFRLNTRALYQVENAALAALALMLWDTKDTLDLADYTEGLASAKWEGRMEEIRPNIVLDGAHNVPGTIAFLKSAATDSADKRLLVYSCMRDKQYDREIELISRSGLFDEVIGVGLDYGRALGSAEIAGSFRKWGIKAREAHSIIEALEEADKYAREKDNYVYFAGSLYLIGAVRGLYV